MFSCIKYAVGFFYVVFILIINSASLFAQTEADAAVGRILNGTQGAYELGEAYFWNSLLPEMQREANSIKYLIVNSTGKNIKEIYISDSSSSNWGRNIWQSQDNFQSGYQIEGKSEGVGPYDIKIVDSQGVSYVKLNVRITSNLAITFTQQDKEKKSLEDKGGVSNNPQPQKGTTGQSNSNGFRATHKVITNDGSNLRLRSGDSIIGLLSYGSLVQVLETSGEPFVDEDGYRGRWTFVCTQDGRTGWCFGAYLKGL